MRAVLFLIGLLAGIPASLTAAQATSPGPDHFARYDDRWTLPALAPTGARPLSMASGDLDGDGMPDLAVGWQSGSGGALTIYRGDVDYLFPQHPSARARRALGAEIRPFTNPWPALGTTSPPDLLAVVDLDPGAAPALVTASIGARHFEYYAAQAISGVAGPVRVDLPGPVHALASGDVGGRDSRRELVLALAGPAGKSWLMLWAGERETTRMLELPEPALALGVGLLDEDGLGDVLVSSARTSYWIRGLDPLVSGEPWSAPQALPATGKAGGPVVMAPPSLAAERAYFGTGADLGSVERSGPGRVFRQSIGTAAPDERPMTFALMAVSERRPLVVSHGSGLSVRWGGSETALELALPGRPLAVLPMRLNGDGFDDLVVLTANGRAPIVIPSAPRQTFVVANTSNLPDCAVGDGICSTDLGSGGGCGSGGCSLRAALMEANAQPGPDAVTFSIGGPASIVDRNLFVTDGTIVDGMTQPGYNGLPVVELVGDGGPNNSGLVLLGAGTTVRGILVRQHTGGAGFALCGTNNILEANIAGPAPGPQAGVNLGNAAGITVADCNFVTVDGGQVGGSVPQARNFAYGSDLADFDLGALSGGSSTANHVEIRGNSFGFQPNGEAVSRGRYSAQLCQDRNISLRDNLLAGVPDLPGFSGEIALHVPACFIASENLIVSGNRIGAGPTGIPNATVGDGVIFSGLQAFGLRIGLPGAGNEIVAFPGLPLALFGSSRDVRVQGNSIGRLHSGTALPNGRHGVYVANDSSPFGPMQPMVLIGGTGPGEANRLLLDVNLPDTAGVLLQSGLRSDVVGNEIEGNQRLAIDLQCAFPADCGAGPTPNDPLDVDDCGSNCANGFQNHPEVTLGGGGFARGTLHSAPNGSYRIDVYAAPSCPSHGRGDLRTYLGQAQAITDAAGNAIWAGAIAEVPEGWILSATATDAEGNTSEPAPCRTSEPGILLRDGFES
jgi:hypothetical protein